MIIVVKLVSVFNCARAEIVSKGRPSQHVESQKFQCRKFQLRPWLTSQSCGRSCPLSLFSLMTSSVLPTTTLTRILFMTVTFRFGCLSPFCTCGHGLLLSLLLYGFAATILFLLLLDLIKTLLMRSFQRGIVPLTRCVALARLRLVLYCGNGIGVGGSCINGTKGPLYRLTTTSMWGSLP